jgi:hypothetical protein
MVTLDASEAAALRDLLARRAIWDCLIRYCRGVDRFDRELVLSAYHPDAIDDHAEFVGGPEAFVDWAFSLHDAGQVATQHHLTNHTCEIDGDTAHAETYYIFTARNRDETLWLAGGRYLDRLEKRGGQWKIAFRYCLIEWSGSPPGLGEAYAHIAELHANGPKRRDRTDASYRRPLTNVRPTGLARAGAE